MNQGKSFEQISEEYSREIFRIRGKIIDDFFIAYAAEISNKKGAPIDLESLVLVEESYSEGNIMKTKWRFEYHEKET